ncbi:FAS1 domain-containing protein [Cynara cardunculus var. scolymus]|uniref:FAS1 domain-containing protein n=1 Tax=Cynara cardunculus var. scolymus TaxID=59895 RepID=A0A103XST8_CYNCS|nr:FAS1 domain-containing protein [Cynara cardunculus var. scolymus]
MEGGWRTTRPGITRAGSDQDWEMGGGGSRRNLIVKRAHMENENLTQVNIIFVLSRLRHIPSPLSTTYHRYSSMAVQLTVILLVALLMAIISFTVALPSETISDATDTLSNSGYYAMSLTLNLVSTSLLSNTSSVTVFTPPESIFADHGEPSVSLLQLHFSPLVFSLSGLRSLPSGTKVPTMSSDTYLMITTPPSSDHVSLNNVKKGYYVMASFLNLQLLGFMSQPSLTLFAPVDEVMIDYSDRFPDYPLIVFTAYVALINVTRSDANLKVNEVPITFPDMYYSDWLVIHGVQELLSFPKPADNLDNSDGDSFNTIHFSTAGNQPTVPDASSRTQFKLLEILSNKIRKERFDINVEIIENQSPVF